MNKSDLITKMAERLSGDRTTATAAVNGVLEEIEGSVARGERVSLSGFGSFDRRERAPRTGRNPRTGEVIQVAASVVPVFRAGAGFRTLVTRADGVSGARQPVADDGVARSAEGEKSRKKGSARAAGRVGSAADAAASDGGKTKGKKTKGKEASGTSGGKDGKGSRKAAKSGTGKKSAKSSR